MQVLLVDDHKLFRTGLRFLLSSFEQSIQFYEADSCESALTLHRDTPIKLILLDYHLNGLMGLDALRSLKQHFCSAAIVMLSGEECPEVQRLTVESGAFGFIAKNTTPDTLLAALRYILNGGKYLPQHQRSIGGYETVDNLSSNSLNPLKVHYPVPAMTSTAIAPINKGCAKKTKKWHQNRH